MLKIVPSHNPKKKYDAIFDDKVVSFGQKGASDFTIHKNIQRKNNYLRRHKKREDWENPETPAALSRYVLWNKPTLKESIEDYKHHFNFNLKPLC